MSQNQSLADQAVDTIAAIRNLDTGSNMDHPERHAVREMKRVASEIVTNALRQAQALVYSAESLQKDMRKHERAAQSAQKGK
ncbi:hypothetical protein GL58_10730 [Comamonas testosteroni]|uniref:Uncharacterized protein n=1 Tax=Comamonas testosteroni TaxID=285 RepID=A0A0L7MGZ5_COMTE|nr:hypothetical protein [Comamonas testosteroni]KOC21160.1 hypothetical protein GL58_10730 [Comamonas testosteroni]